MSVEVSIRKLIFSCTRVLFGSSKLLNILLTVSSLILLDPILREFLASATDRSVVTRTIRRLCIPRSLVATYAALRMLCRYMMSSTMITECSLEAVINDEASDDPTTLQAATISWRRRMPQSLERRNEVSSHRSESYILSNKCMNKLWRQFRILCLPRVVWTTSNSKWWDWNRNWEWASDRSFSIRISFNATVDFPTLLIEGFQKFVEKGEESSAIKWCSWIELFTRLKDLSSDEFKHKIESFSSIKGYVLYAWLLALTQADHREVRRLSFSMYLLVRDLPLICKVLMGQFGNFIVVLVYLLQNILWSCWNFGQLLRNRDRKSVV